jgi:hypothetical protein
MFSGDIVKAAQDSEYYEAFTKSFDERLTKIGITRERRLACPGNHDVSRLVVKPRIFAQLSAVKSCEDEETANGVLFPEFGTDFNQKFENFSAFESKFGGFYGASTYKGSGFSISPEIGVYILNTAICSFGGLEDHKGNKISDKRILHVYTRGLHDWLQSTKFKRRIPKVYLDSCAKDTFMLHDILRALIHERKISYITKSEDKEIKEVMATALLKHKTGKGNQGRLAIEKDIKFIENS